MPYFPLTSNDSVMIKFAKHLLLGALWFTLVPGTSWAQDPAFLTTSGSSIVNGNGENVLLRGVGLGGWMVQEGIHAANGVFRQPPA